MAEQKGQAAYDLVVIGAGAGGASVASTVLKNKPGLKVAIVDPSEYHYYQPAWTLVGGGAFDINDTRHSMQQHIPQGAEWIKARAASFEPEQNTVVLEDGRRLGYQHLLVAAGIQLDWDKIEGLSDTLGKNGVTSNYRYDLAPYTWECVRNLKAGDTALFTQPTMPIKCAGAPQKILYLTADHLRRNGIQADLHFLPAGGAMFGVPFYSAALDKVMADYGAIPDFKHELIAVDGSAKTATFAVGEERKSVEKTFDMLHVVPPQSAPDFIKSSPLANAGGWVDVDKDTLQHTRYPNVFGLGDCTSTPNSKTAAAVRAQAPVCASNLLAAIDGQPLTASYDGYAACPVTTSRGKVMLCEFLYDGVVAPSFPLDPRKPRRFYWWLKRSYMPGLYWGMLSGKYGPDWHKTRQYAEAVPTVKP